MTAAAIRVADDALRHLAYRAAEIAALATMMGLALQGDPETEVPGNAADGLATLASSLADDILDLAEPGE